MDYYTSLPDYEDIAPYLEVDPEGFEPTVKIEDFKPDFSCFIVIDGLPVVNADRVQKLRDFLMRIYTSVSKNIRADDLYFNVDATTGKTPDFAFMKFANETDATNAVKLTNNYELDKKHTLQVCMYKDVEDIMNTPEEFVPGYLKPFEPRPNPTSWLNDRQGRDQFIVRHSNETEIYWSNDMVGEMPSYLYGGEREKEKGLNWCESYTKWSPQGTYLATLHRPGLKIWGGEEFQQQGGDAHGRFMHSCVEEVDFSPCESYMITYVFSAYDAKDAIKVWDIRSGELLRAFSLKNPLDEQFQVQAEISEQKGKKETKVERTIRGKIKSFQNNKSGGSFTVTEGNVDHVGIPFNKVTALQFPNRFKWSADGKYVARLGVGILQIYEIALNESPPMRLLDKKSLAAKDVLGFNWSPRGNLLAYWTPANGNHPAMINIVSLPSREVVCSRKIFDVQDGRMMLQNESDWMIWQNEGDFLCVRMTKIIGKKRTSVLMFFRCCDAGIPVEILELPETVFDVQWEPQGKRVCIVHGEQRSPTISFYSMGGIAVTNSAVAKGSSGKKVEDKEELALLFQLKDKQCNREINWSPAGGVVAIANIQSDSAIFDLHDVDSNVTMATRKHERCTRISWDPSGRIIATATVTELRPGANVRGQSEDGYNLYTFQGTPIVQVRKEKLYQFAWRPRPKELLSPQERKKVIKNLKKYEKIFDKEDRAKKVELNEAVNMERRGIAEEFLKFLNERTLAYRATRAQRIALRDGYDSEDDSNYQVVTELEETVVSTKEQVIS
jgi:translation initiation factor 3 subunit B